jgi:hypothetical protein
VIVPFDVERAFGKKRAKIIATINGELPPQPRPHGHARPYAASIEEIREDRQPFGDEVEVEVEEDLSHARLKYQPISSKPCR